MTKSFKDNYAEMVVKPTTTDEESADAVVITPTVADPVPVDVLEVEEIKIGQGLPIHEDIAPQPVRVELTEEIAEVTTPSETTTSEPKKPEEKSTES